MRKGKNRLDEMQEQKMLHVEHNGFWIGYLGLAIVMLAQLIYYGPGCIDKIGGELVVFMCLSVYMVTGCIRYGVWDRNFAPSWKVNVCASLIAGVAGAVINFVVTYVRYHTWQGCAAAGIAMGTCIFVCTLGCMSLALAAYKLRQKKLEKEADAEDAVRKEEGES